MRPAGTEIDLQDSCPVEGRTCLTCARRHHSLPVARRGHEFRPLLSPCLRCPGGLYRRSTGRVRLGPELFPGIGVLPGPAAGSHIVNSSPIGTAEALRPGVEESHPRGRPLQPRSPKVAGSASYRFLWPAPLRKETRLRPGIPPQKKPSWFRTVGAPVTPQTLSRRIVEDMKCAKGYDEPQSVWTSLTTTNK